MAGLLTSTIGGVSRFWPLASLAVGLGCGLTNGILISRLCVPPFLLTLASLSVVLGAARAVTGDRTVYSSNLPYAWLGSGALFGMPILAMIGLGVIFVSWFVLRRTTLGMAIYAVGGNPAAAHLSGFVVGRVQCAVYGASGLAAGLAAVMVASKLHGANAMQVGQSYTLDAITAVILGGTSVAGGVGSIGGTLLGALLIVVLSNGLILSDVSDMWQSVVKGIVIIAAVVLYRARLTGTGRA